MAVPEVFKYNSLISILLFGFIEVFLIRRIPEFSFASQTISKTIKFIKQPYERLIFRLNFVLKSFIDIGFLWYIKEHFSLQFTAPVVWVYSCIILLFASLSYITEDAFWVAHYIVVYTVIALLSVSQLLFAGLTRDSVFSQISLIAATIPFIISFWYLYARKTNVYVQIACFVISFSWLAVFVFRYL